MSKGFTLIEILAVIIILAIVSIIVTPVVLDVVDESRISANKTTAYNIIDSGKLYFSESKFDSIKSNKINNLDNIYDDVILSGKKPDNGSLYVNNNGEVAVSIVIDRKCYKKQFNSQLNITDDETCSLGYIGNDSGKPDITLKEPSEIIFINSNGWANVNFHVEVNVVDEDSGPFGYKWCVSNTECNPVDLVENGTGSVYIKEERENIVCVIGYDRAGNTSDKVCKTYKLDKTKPEFSGINDVTINKNETLDLSSGVSATDSLSGVDEESYNPTTVDTSIAGTTNVTYSVSDLAGNINTITRKIVVDAEAPTVTFKNDYGWHKANFFAPVTLVDNSGLGIKEAKWCITQENTCVPNAIKGTEDINPQVTVESNNNRICVYLKDNNNKENTMCSDAYKLDKTAPIVGTFNIVGTLGTNGWYTSDVTISANAGSDSLSGNNSSSVNISNITSNTTGTTITLITTDIAGNTSSRTTTIKVDKNAPTVTAISTAVSITKGVSNEISGYFSTSYSISGGSLSCTPTNTSTLTPGTQTVSCTATGNNGLTSSASKSITIKSNIINGTVISCLKSGSCSKGTAVNINVNDTTVIKFFVLEDKGTAVDLIMDSNVSTTGAPYSANTTAWDSGGGSYPTTALNYLANATKNWTNIPNFNYTLNYYDSYTTEIKDVKAKMPTKSQLESTGCTVNNFSCPSWIVDYLDSRYCSCITHGVTGALYYWTSTGRSVAPWYIKTSASLSSGQYGNTVKTSTSNTVGIRPVITLNKSDL